jgi:hypothetical protein
VWIHTSVSLAKFVKDNGTPAKSMNRPEVVEEEGKKLEDVIVNSPKQDSDRGTLHSKCCK